MFNEFCGNETAKSLVEVGILAARKKYDRLPNYLFSGMAGSGKTMLANMIAEEANAIRVYINASYLADPKDVVETLTASFRKFNKNDEKDRIVIIIDEAHALKAKIEDFLLTAISENTICIKENGCVKSLPIERGETGVNNFLSWIFITNRCGEVANALRSRLVDVQFVKYTDEQKARIAKEYMHHNNLLTDTDDCFMSIAKRSWSARNVKRFVDELVDYAVAQDIDSLSQADIDKYFALVGIDHNGLNQLDKAYLEIVMESGNKASLQTISSKLNIGIKDVTEMIEPRLLDLGMIEIDSGGRSVIDTDTLEDKGNPFSV